jgi:hypothetical protein
MDNLNMNLKAKESEHQSNFSTEAHFEACKKIKTVLETQIEQLSHSKQQLHEKLVSYSKNDAELRLIAQ